MQNRFTLLIILLSQAFLLFGQSVEISPNHPNPNDCIYIYTQAFTANLSFQSESQIIEEGNNITIETCFHESPLNATESHYDTIALGPMSEGVYTINYLVSNKLNQAA